MTKLTEITRYVPNLATGDLFYVVDVSDTTEGPAGSSGYTTQGDLLKATTVAYASRAAAQATQVPASVTRFTAGGLAYAADPGGTALTTADGRSWSPDGPTTYEHWGAVGDGVADDTAAIRACHDWVMLSDAMLRPRGRTYRVSGTLLDYDRVRDGKAAFNLVGDGPNRTVFLADTAPGDFLFKLAGDRGAFGGALASNFNFTSFRVESNGNDTCDVFSFEVAANCNIDDVVVRNCRGYAVRALQWWDSRCDISATLCGDDGLGPNSGGNGVNPVIAFRKPAIVLDRYFSSGGAEGGSNNIYFPPTATIEAQRWTALYIGPAGAKNHFYGKIHGNQSLPVNAPHIHLDGADSNMIIGCNFAATDSTVIRCTTAGALEANNNIIIGNYFKFNGGDCVVIDDGRRNIVTGNYFDGPNGGSAVSLIGGIDNLVFGNSLSGSVDVEIVATGGGTAAPLTVARTLRFDLPGSAIELTSPNGTVHRLSVSNTGILQLNGANV